MQDPDLPLLEDVAAGDKEALNELYARHGPPMLNYMTRLLGSRQTAEEVLQNVLLVVWRTASGFRRLSRVRTWMYSIARNQAYKTLERTPPSAEFLDERLLADDEFTESFEHKMLVEKLTTALDKLPHYEREALELVYYKGLTLAETAEYLRIPVNTVKSRLHRARANLRKLLAHEDIGHA
ncbi:MAG: sigma-70 family RNA polymerase sigma factor [Anaerolineae bacterium]